MESSCTSCSSRVLLLVGGTTISFSAGLEEPSLAFLGGSFSDLMERGEKMMVVRFPECASDNKMVS